MKENAERTDRKNSQFDCGGHTDHPVDQGIFKASIIAPISHAGGGWPC